MNAAAPNATTGIKRRTFHFMAAKAYPQIGVNVLLMFRMRFGMSELRNRALAAVDEVAEQANSGPVQRHLALRFALAFLANFADERWPFDNFWRAVALSDEKVRNATVLAARNAIHRAVRD